MRIFTVVGVEASDGRDRVARLARPGGGIGTPVFETMEAADAYLAHCQDPTLRKAVERATPSAVVWLRSLQKQGVDFVVQEPNVREPPADEDFIEVRAFLARYRFAT